MSVGSGCRCSQEERVARPAVDAFLERMQRGEEAGPGQLGSGGQVVSEPRATTDHGGDAAGRMDRPPPAAKQQKAAAADVRK